HGFTIKGTTSVADGQLVTVQIVGTNYSQQSTVTNGTWSVNVTPAQAQGLLDGTYTITANVKDAAGNSAQGSQIFTVDETPPAVAVTGSSSTLNAGQTDTITFTFSEAVTSFDNNDVSVTGGTLGTITKVNDTTYTATFTPTANFEGTGSLQVVASGT